VGNFRFPPRTDPKFLSKFLRAKNGNVDAAILAIYKYYRSIYENLNILEGIKVSEIAKVYSMDCFRFLKHRVGGAIIALNAAGKWNTDLASLRDVYLATAFLAEEHLEDKEF